MANDNLIQEVINDLNFEIIQLKYKNETNVTMRIDTIVEFLEKVKTDVIKAQQNQKFDLHRTATNCTITILDEDNDPITDGSNKLSYGDVIKISVVASTGYENPTISVNGLPFTSGNTMVVKTDLYITGNATASATPFAVNDVLANGDRIQFDTTKGSELTTFLRSLDYTENNALIEQGILPLMKGEATGGGGVWILGIMPTQTENNDALLFMFNLEGVFNVIYSTFAMSNPENPSEGVVEGWNNGIGATGYITLNETEDTTGYVPDNALPITITAINYPTSWNGVIVSKGA